MKSYGVAWKMLKAALAFSDRVAWNRSELADLLFYCEVESGVIFDCCKSLGIEPDLDHPAEFVKELTDWSKLTEENLGFRIVKV